MPFFFSAIGGLSQNWLKGKFGTPHIWVKTMTVMVSCKFARRQSIEHQESGLWYVPTWLEITKNYWEKDTLGLLRGLCSWNLPILDLKWMSRFWTVQEKCADRHIFVCLAKEATVIQSFVVVHASFWCRNRTGWSLQVSLSIPIGQNLSWISPWAFHSNFCMISPTNFIGGGSKLGMGMVPADWLTSPLPPFFAYHQREHVVLFTAIISRWFHKLIHIITYNIYIWLYMGKL